MITIFIVHAATAPLGYRMTDRPRPTTAELEILSVLWRSGPATVRTVHDSLDHGRGTGYTTTLKLMQVMAGKGLLARDERRRSHLYRAVLKPAAAQRRILSRLIAGVFAGSTRVLVQQALKVGKVDAAELAEIRALIDAHAHNPQARRTPARTRTP